MKYHNKKMCKESVVALIGFGIMLSSILPSFAAQSIDGKDYSNWARPAITAIAEKEMLPPSKVFSFSHKWQYIILA